MPLEKSLSALAQSEARADDPDHPRSYTLSSMVVADEIRGYGGAINLLVSIDAGDPRKPSILHVSHIGSHETPSYITGID